MNSDTQKWAGLGVAGAALIAYNLSQPALINLRTNPEKYPDIAKPAEPNSKEARAGKQYMDSSRPVAYGPSLDWLDRLARSSANDGTGGIALDPTNNTLTLSAQNAGHVKLDFSVMSSLMVAGLASGFKSQVANLLWMKSDEYWHQGLFTRQVPLMEAVVTLDPQFIEAWSTAGWHWAYNIYADIPSNDEYKKKGPKYIRALQENAVFTGLDYLKRGAQMNPDTYRLWFEWGWTRAEKAGLYDEETLNLYKIARSKTDARVMEQTKQVNGEAVTVKVQGLDVLGRTIGHLYERIPEFDKALDHYAEDLMKLDPKNPKDRADRAELDKVGEFWHDYGNEYNIIADVYKTGDPSVKAKIRQLEPRIDELVKANDTRYRLGNIPGNDQPVGAYVTISARYMTAWKLWKDGNLDGAVAEIVGIMNADPKYCLRKLPVLAEVMELRGDAPDAVKNQLEQDRKTEQESSEDLGLHFLAKLYESGAAQYKGKDQKKYMAYNRLAYETWYRSRERDALDFYALRNTRVFEDQFGFTAPQKIIDEIKNSRKGGVPKAAPPVPPNVQAYYG